MKEADITINILSYNRKDYLLECLCSVLNQTIKPKLIVINDNGSKRDVYDAIVPFINESVIWRGSEKTYDNLWNFSRAVTDLKTKYVMILHDDDRLTNNFLKTQLKLIEMNPDVLALSANGNLIDKNGNNLNSFIINDRAAKLFYFNNPIDIINHSLTSCIPMSPIIYYSKIFESVSINKKFGKCCDSALYIDIIKSGPILINNDPVYECRVHEFQDSAFFPLNDFKAIFDLYCETAHASNADTIVFNNIYQKFTSISISRIYSSFKDTNNKYKLLDEVRLLFDVKFKWKYFFLVFFNKLK